jgi:hypothetical protein
MAGQTIECDISSAQKMLGQLNAQAVGTILQAAAQGVRNAAIKHFRTRNSEPAKSEGFPRFGESWPKSNFWSGVAKKVGEVTVQGDSATIAISSPALAHKADPNPKPITPKGGRKFLAIPANARAAAYAGMPKDFGGGKMKFGYAETPEGKMMPALLIARTTNLYKGIDREERKELRKKRVPMSIRQDEVQYWLVRKVQTKHDPEALPADDALTTAATRAAQSALNQLARQPTS